MYNPATLRSAFSGVVGFLQSNLPQVPLISAPLTTSTSGIYVQEKHPLVTLENVWYSAPDMGINNYPIWVSLTAYVAGKVVNYLGVLYICTAAVTSATVPSADGAHWSVFNPFQSFLLQKFNQGVTNLFAEIVKMFKLQDSGKVLLEQQQLYRGGGSKTSTIVPTGSFVGFQCLPQQAEGLLVQIDQLGLQFLEDQALDVYLFHTSKKTYVKKVTVQTGGNSSFFWRDIIAQLMCMTYLEQNTQGVYGIGYFESDLTSGNMAISKDWDCSQAPCSGCNGADLMMYNRWSQYTSFRNIRIPPSGLDGYNLPDFSSAVLDASTNWGINLSLTVRCDLTNFIVYSKTLYADAFAMQLAMELLKTIAFSTRVDPTMAQAKEIARAELNVEQKSTFINQYQASLNALKIDMSGFSKSCQPCDKQGNKKSGKWRSV